MEDLIIEYDKNKTKILKYIMYKKRTEKEIIQKFSNAIEKDMLEDIIEELKENDFNLNIPRYVDTFEEEEEIDINAVMAEYKKLDEEDKKITEELNKYLEELGLPKF